MLVLGSYMTSADIETSNKTKVFQTPELAKLNISKSFEEFSSWTTLIIKYIDKIYGVFRVTPQ